MRTVGNREELCVTFHPEEDDPGAVEARLREALAAGLDGLDVAPDGTYAPESWEHRRDRLEQVELSTLTVERRGDRVAAYGVTWDYAELMAWWQTLLSVEPSDGSVLLAHTREAGYMGTGLLYRWTGDGYAVMDRYTTPEGGYEAALVDYFLVEHGLGLPTHAMGFQWR